MPDVTISYKGSSVAAMDASGTKTLETRGKYCEGDIVVQYTDPEKPTQTKSVAPSESAQTVAPDSGKVLSSVTVGGIPADYVGSAVTRKAAQTYTPGTADQTIAAGQYLEGAQTIKGDANLAAGNIKSGVSIFGVAGTHSGGAANCQILAFTLAAHSSTNVTIGTLSDEAYAHIDDANFCVAMCNETPSALVNYDDYCALAQNNANLPATGDYKVYGCGSRKISETRVQALPCYYPPNSTDNTTGIGGVGKFWHNGKTLYYKSASYFLGAGTYRVVITW